MPSRFQQRRARGWSKPTGGRCVSRPSRYGNPFAVSRQGASAIPPPMPMWPPGSATGSRRPTGRSYWPRRGERLRGLDLGCICPLGLPCHADVLLDLVNREE